MGYTFKEMWNDWYSFEKTPVSHGVSRKTPATMKRYQNDYVSFFKDTELEMMQMDRINCVQLVNALRKLFDKKNEKRVKNVICNLNDMFAYAYNCHRIEVNIFEQINRSDLLQVTKHSTIRNNDDLLTTDQCEAYMNYLYSREQITPRYMPTYAIEVAILMNLKLGEVAALRWCDVVDDSLFIWRTEQRDDFSSTKSVVSKNKPKQIKMSQRVKDIFDTMRDLDFNCEDWAYVFRTPNKKRYVESAIGNAVRRFGETVLGINNVNISRLQKSMVQNSI